MVEIYTDGSSKGNPGPGGFGVISLIDVQIRSKDNWSTAKETKVIRYSYSEYCEKTTNNREELKAILHVMRIADSDPDNNYIIYSDSAYAVNICNDWIFNWSKNNWLNSKKKEIENKDLVQNLYLYINKNFLNFQVRKTKGHSNILENELADALATNNGKKYKKLIKDNSILENEYI